MNVCSGSRVDFMLFLFFILHYILFKIGKIEFHC